MDLDIDIDKDIVSQIFKHLLTQRSIVSNNGLKQKKKSHLVQNIWSALKSRAALSTLASFVFDSFGFWSFDWNPTGATNIEHRLHWKRRMFLYCRLVEQPESNLDKFCSFACFFLGSVLWKCFHPSNFRPWTRQCLQSLQPQSGEWRQ